MSKYSWVHHNGVTLHLDRCHLDNRNRRPYGEGLEEAALYVARTKPHFDDGERPVRQHASPASEREIRLAFAVLLELVDRIGEFAPGYCDAATVTGRAFQAALFVTRAHQLQMTGLGTAETIAAGIVVEQIGKFIASRPARKWTRWTNAPICGKSAP